MADIELVIKIPEEVYNLLKNDRVDWLGAEHIIANGSPLPKRHGRLIDADVLCEHFWDNRSKLYTHKDLRIVIDRMPTIIEADKGESEDKE